MEPACRFRIIQCRIRKKTLDHGLRILDLHDRNSPRQKCEAQECSSNHMRNVTGQVLHQDF